MNELIFIQDTLFSVSNIINGGPVLGVDFTEGGKPENPEKKSTKHRTEQLRQLYSYGVKSPPKFKFTDSQH